MSQTVFTQPPPRTDDFRELERWMRAVSDKVASTLTGQVQTTEVADGAITVAKLNVGTLSAITADMGTLTAGTIQQSYTAPGDNNTTPGAGLKITGGKIEAYGNSHAFGGNLVSSDGNYMLSLGRYLTATGKTKRYPLHNSTNFTEDGQTYGYTWNGSAWVELFNLGESLSGSDYYPIRIQRSGTRKRGMWIETNGSDSSCAFFNAKGGGDAVYGLTESGTYGVLGVNTTNSSGPIGVYGQSDYGYSVYGYCGVNTKAPIVLQPSGSASAPSHSSAKGSLWVTSGGKLYINTDGSTTWGLVGTQT